MNYAVVVVLLGIFAMSSAQEYRCEKYLPNEICARLQKVVDNMKLTRKDVDEAVRKAVEQGSENAKDVMTKVQSFLEEKVKPHMNNEKLIEKFEEVKRQVQRKYDETSYDVKRKIINLIDTMRVKSQSPEIQEKLDSLSSSMKVGIDNARKTLVDTADKVLIQLRSW